MNFDVRRASSQDVNGIIAVARETWEATYGNILPKPVREQALAEWYSEQSLLRAVHNPNSAFFVAVTDDGRVVGFANASHRRGSDGAESEDAELWRIYVLPPYQGLGLGRRLIRGCVEALQALRPVRSLYVRVESENDIGRRAYYSFGFVAVREYETAICGHPCPMTEMRLDLAPSR